MDGHGHGHGRSRSRWRTVMVTVMVGHGDGRLKRYWDDLERTGTVRNEVKRNETKWSGRSPDGHGHGYVTKVLVMKKFMTRTGQTCQRLATKVPILIFCLWVTMLGTLSLLKTIDQFVVRTTFSLDSFFYVFIRRSKLVPNATSEFFIFCQKL